ncbi:hypothetical protein GCM10023097_22160 [Streptomyces collinus]|uniref:Pyruvate/2-oxoglutarate dehydrogenase complex dihydrolipoamide dehydrogenase (E3) component n=1 Tax=Streptomyces collinus TaxID=42684 RepID=A0AA89TJM7_STRCU|nr:pyruvate/2-oxoglutarate dehydrogenase complex dihydrolipoamide dehydrogenase (E3) component [Streptomyces collinus]
MRTARGETLTLEAERLLVVVGRAPVTDGLDVTAEGLTTSEAVGEAFLTLAGRGLHQQ